MKYIPRQYPHIQYHKLVHHNTPLAGQAQLLARHEDLHGHPWETQCFQGHVANRQPQPLQQDMVQPLLN